jgi:hypothetical protein
MTIAGIKDAAARLRVRLTEMAVALSLALPEILDQLGVIDLHPVLQPIFGDQKTAAMTTIIMVVLAVMRPIVHVAPKDC